MISPLIDQTTSRNVAWRTLQPDGRTVSRLHDKSGDFLPFAVTDKEIQSARANPNRIVFGPMDANWRTKPGKSESTV